MPISYDEARSQASTYADDTVTSLDCFRVLSVSQPDLVNVVNSLEEFTADGVTYHPHGFKLDDADQEEGTVAQAKISIGFFHPDQKKALRLAAKETPPPTGQYLNYEVDVNGVIKLVAKWDIPMTAKSFDATKGVINITLSSDDMINPAFMKDDINVQRFPMIKN